MIFELFFPDFSSNTFKPMMWCFVRRNVASLTSSKQRRHVQTNSSHSVTSAMPMQTHTRRVLFKWRCPPWWRYCFFFVNDQTLPLFLMTSLPKLYHFVTFLRDARMTPYALWFAIQPHLGCRWRPKYVLIGWGNLILNRLDWLNLRMTDDWK